MALSGLFQGRKLFLCLSSRVRHLSGMSGTSAESLVTCEIIQDRKIAVLSFNDPSKLNALSVPVGEALSEHIQLLKNEPDLRAVVLTGKGKAFSAGGDLNWLLERHRDTPERNEKTMIGFYSKFLNIRSIGVPLICALHGPVIGAGACLATGGCDIRIAEPSTKIAFNFVKIGLHPGMAATHFLPQLVGPAVAAELLLTGRMVNAEEALKLNLISRISPNALEDALSLANDIAGCGPLAVRACLHTLRRRQDEGGRDLTSALEREAQAQAETYNTKDFREGVEAIKEKRQPHFCGQ